MGALFRSVASTLVAVMSAASLASAQTTATLTGVLTDEVTSAPLASTADVQYRVAMVSQRFDGRVGGPEAVTDASGRYTFEGVTPGTYYVRVSNAPSYVREAYDNIPCTANDCTGLVGTPVVLSAGVTTTIDFALSKGGSLSGTVRAANGSPIALAEVYVYNAATSLVGFVTAAADGTYTVPGLPAGTYFARAQVNSGQLRSFVSELYGGVLCPSYGSNNVDAACRISSGTSIAVTNGAITSGIDFSLDPAGTISGRVVAEETSLPLGDQLVEVYRGGLQYASARTATDGTYSIAGLVPDGYRVRTRTINYVDEWQNNLCVGCAGTPATITVASGATVSGIDFSLAPGGAIAGTIDCELTMPTSFVLTPRIFAYNLAGELVKAHQSGPGSCHSMAPSVQYQLRGLPTGQYFLVARDDLIIPSHIAPSGGAFIDQLYPGIPCAAVDCDVRRGVPVSVTAGATTPGIDFAMKVGATSQLMTLNFTTPLRLFDARGVELTNVWLPFLGLFGSGMLLTGVPPGTYFATLDNRLHGRGWCPGCPPTSGQPIVIAPGQQSFVLDFGGSGQTFVDGVVRADPGGAPLSMVSVRLFDSAGVPMHVATTNMDGRYTIVGIGPGTYFMRTENDRGYVDELYGGNACAPCDVLSGTPVVVPPTGATGIDFALATGGIVSGRVIDTSSLGPAGSPVSFFTPSGTLAGKGTTFTGGGYRLTLPEGLYRARAEGTASHAAEIYSEQPCTSAACDVASGTPITVSAGLETSPIDFTPAACSAMTLSPSLLATGVVGSSYRQVFTVSGGTSPMAFQVTAGSPPPGVTMTSAGVLSGTPTAGGRYEFSVGAVDANACATARSFRLDVQECAFVLSPSSATVPAAGGTVAINISGACGPQTVSNATGFVHEQSNTPGQVVLLVDANGGSAARTWYVTIGRRTFGIRQAGTSVTPPFGAMDAPADGSQVSGSLALGGWALDDLEVARVQIFRDPIGGEGAVQIFLGNAVFVRGARPDVARAFPTYPLNDRAGWGFLVLTNMLPNQGNGAFRLYAYADDVEGGRTLLGAKTIIAVNATATAPFGTIDTPAQGATISGASYINFGWALTPQPKIIPFDGSTIHVIVDGVWLGHPSYNHFRADVAGLFPGLANTSGPVGFLPIDTTALAEGQHTIAWVVYDDANAGAGIGSRYFSVANSADAQPADQGGIESGRRTESLAGTPVTESPVIVDGAGELRRVDANDEGSRVISLGPLERLELTLASSQDESCAPTWAGYLVDEKTLAKLPVGSTIDPAGTFYWQPGPGFLGTFELMFVRTACDGSKSQLPVTVKIRRR